MEGDQYVRYLQQLLEDNHITHLDEHTFGERQETPPKEQEKEQSQSKEEEKSKKGATLPTNVEKPLDKPLIERYSRQMLLKEIGYQGQVKIVQVKVALIGSGGIGCPLALYLAAAGVGTLGLFDSDTVDVTNLHRQIGHRTDRIGMEKTESLKQTILAINPNITVQKHPFVTAENAHLLDHYDYVIDGSDNPKCRYIVNDYCMARGKKLLSGACIGWEAQITCYGGSSLCYRCLWGNDQVSMGGCSTLGVVGMLPGLVGMVLAIQALKLIIHGQSSLEGKLLTFDGRRCEFKKVGLRKKKDGCIGCGSTRLDIQTYDYGKYSLCSDLPAPQVEEISWQTFLNSGSREATILDVRPSTLYNIVHFLRSESVPLEQLRKMSREEVVQRLRLKEDHEAVPVSCVRGNASRHAVEYLKGLGIRAVSIAGGIKGYSTQHDSSVPLL